MISFIGFSQTISGIITNQENNTLPSVNISLIKNNIGTVSKNDGSYKLEVPANRSIVIAYSFIGYEIERIRIPMLKKGQNYILKIFYTY